MGWKVNAFGRARVAHFFEPDGEDRERCLCGRFRERSDRLRDAPNTPRAAACNRHHKERFR